MIAARRAYHLHIDIEHTSLILAPNSKVIHQGNDDRG